MLVATPRKGDFSEGSIREYVCDCECVYMCVCVSVCAHGWTLVRRNVSITMTQEKFIPYEKLLSSTTFEMSIMRPKEKFAGIFKILPIRPCVCTPGCTHQMLLYWPHTNAPPILVLSPKVCAHTPLALSNRKAHLEVM